MVSIPSALNPGKPSRPPPAPQARPCGLASGCCGRCPGSGTREAGLAAPSPARFCLAPGRRQTGWGWVGTPRAALLAAVLLLAVLVAPPLVLVAVLVVALLLVALPLAAALVVALLVVAPEAAARVAAPGGGAARGGGVGGAAGGAPLEVRRSGRLRPFRVPRVWSPFVSRGCGRRRSRPALTSVRSRVGPALTSAARRSALTSVRGGLRRSGPGCAGRGPGWVRGAGRARHVRWCGSPVGLARSGRVGWGGRGGGAALLGGLCLGVGWGFGPHRLELGCGCAAAQVGCGAGWITLVVLPAQSKRFPIMGSVPGGRQVTSTSAQGWDHGRGQGRGEMGAAGERGRKHGLCPARNLPGWWRPRLLAANHDESSAPPPAPPPGA